MIFVLLGANAMAQQDPMYTQYMNQILSINPAYAGSKGVTSATFLDRRQWSSWKNSNGTSLSPETATLFVHSPLNTEMGVGGSFLIDKMPINSDAAVTNYAFFGDYSYTITYPGEKYLSLGLKLGFAFYSAQLSNLYLGESGQYDPAFKDISNKFLPNAGVGVYFSSPNYYLGFSVPKLITNKISQGEVETGTVIREEIHAFFMGGYVFDINRILKFKPYFMVRVAPNSPISADLTAQCVLFDRFWVGATYRTGCGIGAMVQLQVTKQLKIGYAYDLTTNELGSYNAGGTHEILVNFDFSFGRGRVRSPRYF